MMPELASGQSVTYALHKLLLFVASPVSMNTLWRTPSVKGASTWHVKAAARAVPAFVSTVTNASSRSLSCQKGTVMSISSDGQLSYGYDLGGPESGWQLAGAGEYGEAPHSWMTDENNDGLEEVVAEKLKEAGLTGVTMTGYCSYDYPLFTLVTKEFTCSRGECVTVDFTIDPEWDAQLARALEVLDLKPLQERPAWLLTSMYG